MCSHTWLKCISFCSFYVETLGLDIIKSQERTVIHKLCGFTDQLLNAFMVPYMQIMQTLDRNVPAAHDTVYMVVSFFE